MLQFAGSPATPIGKSNPVTFVFDSNAAVDLNYDRQRRVIHLTLRGVMVGVNSFALQKFLRVIAHLPATQWALQMRDLELINLRGIWHLAHFIEILRVRGVELKILAIHPNVYATLRDLNLLSALAGPAGKLRAPSTLSSSTRRFAPMSIGEI